MPRPLLDQLQGKEVEIYADGMIYRGILIEITTEGVTLRRQTGFAFVAMDRIASIRDPNAPPRPTAPRFVDPSFYNADLPQETPPAPSSPGGKKPVS